MGPGERPGKSDGPVGKGDAGPSLSAPANCKPAPCPFILRHPGGKICTNRGECWGDTFAEIRGRLMNLAFCEFPWSCFDRDQDEAQ
jgi:hypothetical protein